jgi:hypothetical protein
MKKIFFKDETFWTVLLGTIGCFALLWNLLNNPSDWPNIIVNFAQIGVAVIVFFIANNIFKDIVKKRSVGFNEKFEQYLLEWANHNKYLIDATNIDEEKGKDNKRTIDMIVNHDNFVFGTRLASEFTGPRNKGAFLYLPLKKDLTSSQIFQFKINKGMFLRKTDIDYEKEKNKILDAIASRINYEFDNIGIRAKRSSEPEKIDVDFSNMEKTDENARRLIDVVEFVKTIFLAIA